MNKQTDPCSLDTCVLNTCLPNLWYACKFRWMPVLLISGWVLAVVCCAPAAPTAAACRIEPFGWLQDIAVSPETGNAIAASKSSGGLQENADKNGDKQASQDRDAEQAEAEGGSQAQEKNTEEKRTEEMISKATNLQKAKMIVVVGAAGEEKYAEQFAKWAESWRRVADSSGIDVELILAGDEADGTQKQRLRQQLELVVQGVQPADEASESDSGPPEVQRLWLVFIGHGTYLDQVARFNLQGPDITAQELAQWLEEFANPLVFINCASCSAPFINALSGPQRIIITSTQSGDQYNYSRFGEFIADSISADAIDLDKDEQISLLEAFLSAARQTARFYESESRLATENALLDDNADQLGTSSQFFRGIRVAGKASGNGIPDGLRANQVFLGQQAKDQLTPALRSRRDEIELRIEALRQRKQEFALNDYLQQLERLMLEMAAVYGLGADDQDPQGAAQDRDQS